ncbi:Casparian strip membrane protein domain [Dillenia turbinata]|uniref:CASP-like protein n=1 Tax=Dillenia turbinata TaxID=194707 RepID=A0AAN8VJ83_9MAGN
MNVSHPAVHPVEAQPMTDGAAAAAVTRLRMKDIQGMPGTLAGLILRFAQFVFAAVALCVMATTSDFASATSFRLLEKSTVSKAITWKQLSNLSFQNNLRHIQECSAKRRVVSSTLTFASACASAGIAVLIGNDLANCSKNHCTQFETATAMAFLSWC